MKKTTLAIAVCALLNQAPSGFAYEVTTIGQPIGASGAAPSAVSGGVVAINADFPQNDSLHTVPYLWVAGKLSPLPLGIYSGGGVLGLNDAGIAVGYVTDSGGGRFPALWSSGQLSVLSHGSMAEGVAFSINHQGQIAGQLSTHDGTDFAASAANWNSGVLTDLGNFGGTDAAAKAINSTGQMLIVASGNSGNSVFLKGQSAVALGPTVTGATAVDNAGRVLAVDAGGNNVIWQNGVLTPLGSAGGLFDVPLAMNDAGDVVGYAETSDFKTHAILWQNGQALDLSTLAGQGWNLTAATGISDDGAIVAIGTFHGDTEIVLLTPDTSPSVSPVPESASLALLAVGAGLLLARRRRGK